MKMVFHFIIYIICFRYISSKCRIESPRNRSIYFNIELEENERTEKEMNGAIYTPDSCCYAWTNYNTIANKWLHLTYCGSYEKSKTEETIKTIKDSYKNYDEIVGFDMFIDCGDKQEKEEEKEEDKEEDKEEEDKEEDEKEEGKEEVKEKEEKDNHDSNEENSNKGDFNNNLYIILNICLLLILIF